MDSYPYHHQQNQPPPPASYYNHAPPPPQQPYNYPYPHQPYNYPPPPPPTHPQQYAPPPPPPLHHSQYPPPTRSHFPPPHLPPPGAPTAYSHPPPPDQWGNASWQRHQGWDYSERNDPYNNKEDWASKAKEWATTKVGTEMVHAHSHFAPVDDNRYTYHNQFQQPNQQLSNQQQHAVDPLNQATYTHGSGSYAAGYNAGDETIKAKASEVAPSQKNYGSTTSSVYEQEVSYSYSSAPAGHQDSMHQTQSSHVPMPAHFPVNQESFHSQSLPPPVVAGEQPHLSNHGPASFMPDVCDRPLDFVSTHKPEYKPRRNADFAPMSSSVHTWTTQIPLGPAAPFDPAYVPQASIPMHAPNFQSSMPPVSAASSYAFNADPSVNMNFSERPKKATVPNWLREEIIKNKPVIPSMASALPAENSINSVGSEDGDNSMKRVDLGDNKSISSIKSTEDEDDEEEDAEAARTAALNQEIKRVLTEILLKVTDELFDEIATKVLDEEQQTIVVGEDSSANGNHKASVPTTTTQKASAKVLIPYNAESSQADNGEENTSTSSPGGNLLGLATYASDDEDEIQSSKAVSSENEKSVYRHQESKHDNKQVKDGTDNGSAVRKANNVAKTVISSVESLSHIEKASVATKSNIDGNKRDKDEPLTKDDNGSINSLSRGDKRSSIEKISCENSVASDSVTQLDKNRPEEKHDKDKSKKKEDDKKSERRSNMKESDRGSSKQGSNGNDKEDRVKDKRDKHEDGEKKRERIKDEKEDQSKRAKESAKYNHRRSLSPSSRGVSNPIIVVCHHHQQDLEKDKIQGLHIAGILIAGILLIHLLREGEGDEAYKRIKGRHRGLDDFSLSYNGVDHSHILMRDQ